MTSKYHKSVYNPYISYLEPTWETALYLSFYKINFASLNISLKHRLHLPLHVA